MILSQHINDLCIRFEVRKNHNLKEKFEFNDFNFDSSAKNNKVWGVLAQNIML